MEENAEQEKADEETDFELSEMEEDDIDLLEPSQNADTDAFVENDDGMGQMIWMKMKLSQRRCRMRQTTQLPTK